MRDYKRKYQQKVNGDPKLRARQAANSRRWRERIKEKPEEYQRILEDARIRGRLWRERQLGELTPPKGSRVRPNNGRNGVDALPVGPFREWAERRMATMRWGVTELAEACGMTERSMRRVLYEQQSVTLGLADRALLNEGSAFLWELWPQLRS